MTDRQSFSFFFLSDRWIDSWLASIVSHFEFASRRQNKQTVETDADLLCTTYFT